MGPPKECPPRLTYAERLERYDTFEQRIDFSTNLPYLSNPYTGETIYDYDSPQMDRSKSMWGSIKNTIAVGTIVVHLYPTFYASRRWGRRPFNGWNNNKNAAATHISSVYRGYCARKALRLYYKERYEKRKCQFSGWWYFNDKWHYDPINNTESVTWYKPLLAFPDDINEYVEVDPEDHMKGDKYTYRGFANGPYVQKKGIAKYDTQRSQQEAFKKPDPLRDIALTHVDEIDLETTPLGSLIPWMEGLKTGHLIISDYTNMRVACRDNNWRYVLNMIEKYPDRKLTHAYALFAFSKMEYEVERDGGFSVAVVEAFDHCFTLIDDPYSTISPTLKVFALYTLEKFLHTLQGRSLFFDASKVKVTGKKRAKAVFEYFQSRLVVFTNLIDGMEYESQTFSGKVGSDNSEMTTTVHTPTCRAVDMGSFAMACISLLGQEQEHRELMAETVTTNIIKSMLKCENEPTIQLNGTRALYNMCYRCQAAQMVILMSDTRPLIEMLYRQYSGDSEVKTMVRRLELALTGEGWRGTVEKQMEKEFKEELEKKSLNSTPKHK